MFSKIKTNFWLAVIIFSGTITQGLTMVKSGWRYDYGMGFWGPNAHDGLWHIALINQLREGSLAFPTFAGFSISNYHIGFDLLVSIANRFTGLSPVLLYFQIFPVIFSFLYGFITYHLSYKFFHNKTAALFSTFFAYFGGSLGWLVNLIRGESLGGESMFWSMQSISFLINPPFILSVIVLLLGLRTYGEYLERKNAKWLVICSFLFGILIQIKAYAGMIILGILFLTSVSEILSGIVKYKKITIVTFPVFLLTLLISIIIFLPLNAKSQSVMVFRPLWFIQSMFSFSDRLNIPRMEIMRQAAVLNTNIFKYSFWLVSGMFLFFLGNLGTRFIGFIGVRSFYHEAKYSQIAQFFLYGLLLSFLPTLFFIQIGTNWNTIQFFYYFLVFMNFLAGLALATLIKSFSNFKKIIFIFLVVLVTVPTTLTSLKNYWPSRPPAKISNMEIEALEYLSKQPKGIVLTYPFAKGKQNQFTEPRPVYAYLSTSYVSALSKNITFLEDEMMSLQTDPTGQAYDIRLKLINNFFTEYEEKKKQEFLLTNQIRYVYLLKSQITGTAIQDFGLKKIFENDEVLIYLVS